MAWKVPEENRLADQERGGCYGDPAGAFSVYSPYRKGYYLLIIASPGGTFFDPGLGRERTVTWEHVSVHASYNMAGPWQDATPTWDEMDFVKGLFWDPEDVVMQLHVNDGRKVDNHPYTLHLWRPTDWAIALPDPDLV